MSDAPADPLPPAPAKQSPVVLLGVLFNTALLLVVVAKVFFFATPGASGSEEGQAEKHAEGSAEPKKHGEKKGEKGGLGPTVKLPDFVVHLRNPEAERYARMSFELEVGGEEEKGALSSAMPKVREVFISYLSDRTVEELRGSEGIERTKKELLARLEKDVEGSPVRGIYITDIVIQ